jgi:MFS family permease
MAGILVMAVCISLIFFLPVETLTLLLTRLPLLGNVPVIGAILMVIGIGWSMININSLPMVVDMTEASRIGTYTGLYYLFSTLAAILGPILYGFIIQFSDGTYNLLMLVSPIFLTSALISLSGIRSGEARPE